MFTESPVLDLQAQLVDNCRDVLQDKMQMITSALTLQGKVKRMTGYDPLAGALTQLAIMSRRLTPETYDAAAIKSAIDNADDRWWEWYDNRPRGLEVPYSAMNYALRSEDRLALREQLRAKYAVIARERTPEPETTAERAGK